MRSGTLDRKRSKPASMAFDQKGTTMSDIILSSAIRSNLTSLQSTAHLIGQTQTRPATGKKANPAPITSTGNVTVQQIIDGVNNTASLKVKAELSGDGKILLEATSTNTIVLAGTATAPEQAQFGLVAGTTAAGTTNTTRSSLAT